MNESDELDDATTGFELDAPGDLSLPGDDTLTLRLKTWTVPLSLETANQCAVGENAILYMSALSAPLRTCSRDPVTHNISTMLCIQKHKQARI